MKKIIIIIGAILFSTFFFKQNIGLNLLLFTLVATTILGITNWKSFKNKITIIKTIAYLITGITVFLYNSELVILSNIIAFFTLVGSISENKSSIYIKWINGIYTTVVSFFAFYYDSLGVEVENVKKEKINYSYWFKIIGIPAIILLIFILLYRNANPVFDELIEKIDLSFINFQWILFTGLGFYLFNNITNPIQIEPITSKDLQQGNYLLENELKPISKKSLKNEKQLAVILMILLNILILFFIATDIVHLSKIHSMIAPRLSEQVHNGVNALIISNILAIIIILYFFRGSLNFFNKNKDLKNLAYVWIFLNLSVVIITMIKNVEYIVSFGLTYKRIGVLFFLTATSIGLITTFIKVSKVKNLSYLFRKNIQIAFIMLIISTTLNWDKMITQYNFNYAEQLDLKYLINLSNNNTFLLKEYADISTIDIQNKTKINRKYTKYIRNLKENSWQEKVYDNYKIK